MLRQTQNQRNAHTAIVKERSGYNLKRQEYAFESAWSPSAELEFTLQVGKKQQWDEA